MLSPLCRGVSHRSGHREHNANGVAVWYNDAGDTSQALCDYGASNHTGTANDPDPYHYAQDAQRFCPCGRYGVGGHEGGPHCPQPRSDAGPSASCPPSSTPPIFDFTVTMDPQAGRWCPSPDTAGVWVDVFIPAFERVDLEEHYQCDFIAIVPYGAERDWAVLKPQGGHCEQINASCPTRFTNQYRATCPTDPAATAPWTYNYIGAVDAGPATTGECARTDDQIATHAVFECVPPGEHEIRLYRSGYNGFDISLGHCSGALSLRNAPLRTSCGVTHCTRVLGAHPVLLVWYAFIRVNVQLN